MKTLLALLLCITWLSGCSHTGLSQTPKLSVEKHNTVQQSPTLKHREEHREISRAPAARQPRFTKVLDMTHGLCPKTAVASQDAAPHLDSDGDGVSNLQDECPATPGNLAVDGTGCPLSLFLSLTIPFQSSQAIVSDEQHLRIQRIALLLKNNPHSKITLSGHSDNSGDAQINMQLSEKRAQFIKDSLIQMYGLDPQRILSAGFGDTKPMVSNKTALGRERNRRVDIELKGYYSSHTSYVALHRPYNIQFEANQTELNNSLHQQINSLGDYLRQHPGTMAKINGYTDSSGNEANNMTISVMRAQTIKQLLMNDYNISSERLQVRGYGQNNPIADNATEEGRRLNRRVIITLNTSDYTSASTHSRFHSSVRLPQNIDSASAPLADQFDIRFKQSASRLEAHTHQTIDAVGKLMRARPDMRIVIEGHASGQAYMENHRISQARAQNVKKYLQQRYEIDATRLRAIGFGKRPYQYGQCR